MSIEQSLSALAESNNALAAALTNAANILSVALQGGNAAINEAATAPTTGKGKGKAAQAAAATPAPGQPTATAAAAAAQSSKELDFKNDIRPLFLQLVNEKGQAAGRNLIDRYDPSKSRLSEAITPAQYAEVKALIEQELGLC